MIYLYTVILPYIYIVVNDSTAIILRYSKNKTAAEISAALELWVSVTITGYYGELIFIVGLRIRGIDQYICCNELDEFEICSVIDFFFHFISSYVFV